MKLIKNTITSIIVAIFSIGMLTAQNSEREILTTTEITVKLGHHTKFIEGVKKWKDCYLENEGENTWNMWHRQQGEGNVYIMSGMKAKWAEMDKEDESSNACYQTLLNDVSPHIEKVSSRIARTMPEVSRSFPEDAKYIRVTYYEVHKEYAFEQVISAVTKAINDKEGAARGIWYNNELGGPDTPDFFVAEPYTKYADIDIERDSPARIYTDAVGEEKAGEMWEKWFDTLENSWTYIYELNAEMSNN